jgi:hypothetical protein
MSVIVQGVEQLIIRLREKGSEGKRLAGAIVGAVGDMIVNEAKQLAPVDLGKIRQGIGKEVENNADRTIAKIFSAAPESPYQEFGTGGKVDVPEEMSEVASYFIGGGGNGDSGGMVEFIQALTDWVRRHGLTNTYSVSTRKVFSRGGADRDEQLAWAIAKKILREGLKPQPFLYPAYVANKGKLVPMLEDALKQMLAK